LRLAEDDRRRRQGRRGRRQSHRSPLDHPARRLHGRVGERRNPRPRLRPQRRAKPQQPRPEPK
jgi:hypothetical protein